MNNDIKTNCLVFFQNHGLCVSECDISLATNTMDESSELNQSQTVVGLGSNVTFKIFTASCVCYLLKFL